MNFDEIRQNEIVKKGEKYLQEGNYNTAIRYYEMALKRYPKNLWILYCLANLNEKVYQLDKAAQYYLWIIDITKQNNVISSEIMLEIVLNAKSKVQLFFFVALQMMHKRNYDIAILYLSEVVEQNEKNDVALYYLGICYMKVKNFIGACKALIQSIEVGGENYNKLFYLANVCYYQSNFVEALALYQKVLLINSEFFEAQYNLNILKNHIVDKIIEDVLDDGTFIDDYKQIPIFINSRDRLNGLKKLILWFRENGYHNIYILDNKSTYIPLLEFYNLVRKEGWANVIYLNNNLGHLALWKSQVLEELQIKTPFVYTDSDVVPIEKCPDDCLKYMLAVLRNNPLIQKVGLGLQISDLPENSKYKKSEEMFWQLEPSPNIYFAYTDTTFALYRYSKLFHIKESMRIGYPYLIRHLPWYYDKNNLPEDEKYYVEHANSSSTFAKEMKV